jgi:broad specificity phosphatase PhoE
MRIFFVRHGESQANVDRIFSNRGWKHPLTQRGREQVEALATKLVDRRVIAVCSSPIQRAVESAQIITLRLRIPHQIEPGLAEWDVGIYEDRPHDEGAAAYAEVEQEWASGRLDARIPQGESCSEVRARFAAFILRLIEEFNTRPDVALVLVGHGGTYRHALPAVLSNVSGAFAMGHGLDHVDVLEAELRDDQSLHCVRWGDEVMA